MSWQQPERTEGKVWLAQFNENFTRWLSTHEPETIRKAAASLRHLLDREPAMARTVAKIISTLLYHHAEALAVETCVSFAELGEAAERLLSSDDPDRLMLRAWLRVERGHIELRAGEPPRAEDAAVEAVESLNAVDAARIAPLASFMRIRANALRAKALDEMLAYERAIEQYGSVEESTRAFVDDNHLLSALLKELIPFLYEAASEVPLEAVRSELRIVWQLLSTIRIEAGIGGARAAALAEQSASVIDAAARVASGVIRQHGLGVMGPLSLVPIVSRANADVALELVKTAIEQSHALGLEVDEYRAVLEAAASAAATSLEDREKHARAAKQSLRRVADPLIRTAASGLLVSGDPKKPVKGGRGSSATRFDDFLTGLAELEMLDDPRINDPRVRSVLERPIAAALEWAMARYERTRNATDRARLSLLFDAGSGDTSTLAKLLRRLARGANGTSSVQMATALSSDTLGRLQRAMRDYPKALAIIERSSATGTALFCVASGEEPQVLTVDTRYRDASIALAERLRQDLRAYAALRSPKAIRPAQEIERLGHDAFLALPAELRGLIDGSDTLLICPDYRTGGDATPYEMFFDGSGWLGTRKVVARFPTLRLLVRATEGTAQRDVHARVLAVAVADPKSENLPPLRSALDDVATVRSSLAPLGWEAPEIEPGRVTSDYVLDALPLVAHVHIAAHGSVREHDEALLLAAGSRLTPADLTKRFRPCMPTAFLNACWVGRTRYRGGGVSHGLAHGLLEAGAPTVLANTLPVEDRVASQLAAEFYSHAQALPMGEALRRARETIWTTTRPAPQLWSSIVLMGDPRPLLSPAVRTSSISERLLETMFAGRDTREREAIHRAATARLLIDPEDIRLAAAAALLREVASWPAKPDASLRQPIASACRAALELDSPAAVGMLAFLLSETYDDRDDSAERLQVVEAAVEVLESIESDRGPWKQLLDRLLARWLRLRRGDRMPQTTVRGPVKPEERSELMQFGEVLVDLQLAVEAREIRRGDAPTPRSVERGEEDVLWNGVLASRTQHLESMPEISDFATQTAEKLVRFGSISADGVGHAATALAGLLKWLWGAQNTVSLPREMVIGQTGTLAQLLRSLQSNWPPAQAEWFEAVRDFPGRTLEALASLENLPYDDRLYPALHAVIDGIERSAGELLESAGSRYPERAPDIAVWVLGCLIECNTYSYTDGSVPEDIGEGLDRVHAAIDAKAEGSLMPWLMEGFRPVREQVYDELTRWKYGIGANALSPTAERAEGTTSKS